MTMAAAVAVTRSESRSFIRTGGGEHEKISFRGRRLDDVDDLRRSFQLRHRVYCGERRFLAAENYVDGIETDSFDDHSLHFGSFNHADDLVGTVRLVRGRLHGLPMHEHCPLFPQEIKRLGAITNLTEISRLAVSRTYRRRLGDGIYGASTPATADLGNGSQRNGDKYTIVLTLYRAIYQALKQHGIRHVLAAMEPSLRRVLTKYHFPFLAIGPAVDYYGPVVPYYLDLDLLDDNLSKASPELLRYFNDGLDLLDETAVADERIVA